MQDAGKEDVLMASKNRKYGPNHPWTKFKMECASDIGHLQFVKEKNDHYKGDLPSSVNGYQGGPIGGEMVKRMIAKAEDTLSSNQLK